MGTAPAVRPSSPSRRPPPRAELRALLERAVAAGATGTDVAVLSALWTHADRHGGCWPSQPRLARLARRCERTVRTSVQRLDALGVIARAVPTHGARRWGWTDPATGERRWSRRSTVYVLTADEAREPRPVATIGHPAEPCPELDAAAARVAAAVARARAQDDDAPALEWGGEAVVVVPVEPPPAWATSSSSSADEAVSKPHRNRIVHGPFAHRIDRQPLPPKSPREKSLSALSVHVARARPAPDPTVTGEGADAAAEPRRGPFRAPSVIMARGAPPDPAAAPARPPARSPPSPLADRARRLLDAAARRGHGP